MLKLIYAVAGEGYGHATRSKPIIEHLNKKHAVVVYAGGKAYEYLKKHFPVKKISSMHMIYKDNKVSTTGTILHNIIRSPLHLLSFLRILTCNIKIQPDTIITDYEPFSTWSAIITRTPLISIHLPAHSIIENHKESIPEKYRQLKKYELVNKIIIPKAPKQITPTFYSPAKPKKHENYTHPIIREQIKKLETTKKDHILVYQTSTTNYKLIEILKQFPKQKIIAYGFKKTGKEQNIEFKQFNEKEFFEELASAKAIITNGGIGVLTEAIYLNKPILSLPIQEQGEQIINACHLEKLNYGKMGETNEKTIKKFITKIPKTNKAPKWENEKTLEQIEQIIINSSRKQNNS